MIHIDNGHPAYLATLTWMIPGIIQVSNARCPLSIWIIPRSYDIISEVSDQESSKLAMLDVHYQYGSF